MGWAAVIAMIIELVGPYLMEWLKQLLERWLSRAAADLPAPAGPDDVVDLFNDAMDRLPRLAFARRAMLRAVKRVVTPRAAALLAGAVSGLTIPEMDDLKDAAGAVEIEVVGA